MRFAFAKFGLGAFILLAFTLVLAVFGVVGVESWRSTGATLANIDATVESQCRMHLLDDILQSLTNVERAARNFVYTGDPELTARYASARNQAVSVVRALRLDAAGDLDQSRALAVLAPIIEAKLAVTDSTIAARRGPGGDRAAYLIIRSGRAWQLMEQIQDSVVALRETNRRRMVSRTEALSLSARSANSAVAVGEVLAMFVTALALTHILREMAARNRARLALASSEAGLRDAHEAQAGLIVELKAALSNVKTLSGLLPVCSCCRKIRDDTGYWGSVERYVSDHTDARFSHGVCPDCYPKLYPGIPFPVGENVE